MNITCRARRCLAAAALCAVSFVMPGCFGSDAIFTGAAWATSVGGAATGGATALVMVSDKATHGPRVTFHNDSPVPVQVRYYVGRVDVTAPYGATEFRNEPKFTRVVEPGDGFSVLVGKRSGWVTSNSDAIVWVRLDPGHETVIEPDEKRARWIGSDLPQWFELKRPHPLAWHVVGDAADLVPQRLGGGGPIVPVPKEAWIGLLSRAEREQIGEPMPTVN